MERISQRLSKKRLLLSFLIIISIIIGTSGISDHGIWQDEKTSLLTAVAFNTDNINFDDFSSSEIWKSSSLLHSIKTNNFKRAGTNYIYNIFLHFQIKFFGASDTSTRCLSVLFYILSSILIFYVTNFISKNKKLAFIVTMLYILNPMNLSMAHEVRAYTIATFFSLFASLILLRIIYDNQHSVYSNKNFIAYGILIILSILAHYSTIYIFIFHGIIVLFFFKWPLVKRFIVFILPVAGILGFYYLLVIAPNAPEIRKNNQVHIKSAKIKADGVITEEERNSIVFISAARPTTIVNIIKGDYQQFCALSGLGFLFASSTLSKFIIPLLFVVIFLFIFGIFYLKKENKKYFLIPLVFLSIASPVFATILAIISGHTISFDTKYAIFSAPYFIILASFGVHYLFKIIKNSVIKIILIVGITAYILSISLMFSHNLINYPEHWNKRIRNPYMHIAELIVKEYQPGDIVLFPQTNDALICNLYFQHYTEIKQQVKSDLKDKVAIKKLNGELTTIYNLKDKRY